MNNVEDNIYKIAEIASEIYKENIDISNEKWMVILNQIQLLLDDIIKELQND